MRSDGPTGLLVPIEGSTGRKPILLHIRFDGGDPELLPVLLDLNLSEDKISISPGETIFHGKTFMCEGIELDRRNLSR